MSYNKFETETKKILKDKFSNSQWYKVSNADHFDFIGIGFKDYFTIHQDNSKEYKYLQPIIRLVEAKSTKNKVYYPFENIKRRNQLQAYIEEQDKLKAKGYLVECYLFVKIQRNIKIIKFEKLEDIPRSIK